MAQVTSYSEDDSNVITNNSTERLSPIEQQKIIARQGGYIHSDAYWYNPIDENIYRGEFSEKRPNWDRTNVVLNTQRNKEVAGLYKKGNYTDAIGMQTAGYSDEMYPKVMEFLEVNRKISAGDKNALENNLAQGGMLTRQDYINVKTLQTESRIVLAKPEAHVLLDNIVERVATNEFSFKWYKIDSPYDAIVKKVSDQQVFHTGSLKYSTDTATLDIYGAELGTTWEFRQETFDIPVYQNHLQNLEGQFDRARNEAVAEVINAVSGTEGGNWASKTNNANNENPVDDLELLADTINATRIGTANTIVSNKKVWRTFRSSTPWIQGNTVGVQSPVVNALPYQSAINFVVQQVPQFEGFKWVVDDLITAEEVSVLDPRSIRFWDGPQRTITWSHTQTDEEGVIYKAYFAAKNVETELQEKLTNILGSTAA